MKPEQLSSLNQTKPRNLWLRQVWRLSSLGLLGTLCLMDTPAARAEVETDGNGAIEARVPTPAATVTPIAPVETKAEALLSPQVSALPTVEPLAPAPAPAFEAAPAPVPVVQEPPMPKVVLETHNSASETADNFIDTTDYSLGATVSPDQPALVFSERSTGCQLTLQQGQTSPTQSCGATETSAVAANNTGSGDYEADANTFSLGPVSVGGNGVMVGNTTVISREYFNEKLRSLNLFRRGTEEFVFPLAIPSPITSLFGWRQHPIFGDRRFHTGTDLGAPEGTPVVATQDGEVHIADYLGGYGLTVILRHAEGTFETRYAHLSRILVRPGETIKQGDVVGLVGSTGNSTGPHLHFELRELTAQGWILHNPDELMQYAMTNLVDAINNPLLAFGLEDAGKTKDTDKVPGEKELALPYRPAQPNAN